MRPRDFSENKKEAENEFRYIVNEYILPLLPVRGELRPRQSDPKGYSPKKLIEYCGDPRCFRIYPCLNEPQVHFEIDCVGKKSDTEPATTILTELMKVAQYAFDTKGFSKAPYYDLEINGVHVYRRSRYALAFEQGMCNWLGNKAVYRLLEKMSKWAQKTYEGKRIPFSFIIDVTSKAEGSRDFFRFLDSNHSAVFTDGFTSGIALDSRGQIVRYFSSNDTPDKGTGRIPYVPYRFRGFAEQCRTDEDGVTWVGIIAQTNGDILVFKKYNLVFAKRNGKWHYVNPDAIIFRIQEFLDMVDDTERMRFAQEIYLSLLDVSFAHTGGCLAVTNESHKKTVTETYIKKDHIDDESESGDDGKQEKKHILKRLMYAGMGGEERIFHQLDRKLRQELLGLDGATVIDAKGRILGAGAIVKIEGGSDEGGRYAAATQMAQYGFAVKVSTDGGIQGFVKGCGETTGEKKPVEAIISLFT